LRASSSSSRVLLPVRDAVRKAEAIEIGDVVSVDLVISLGRPDDPGA
jgi:hypothetical protein